jgi:hypothetical protein
MVKKESVIICESCAEGKRTRRFYYMVDKVHCTRNSLGRVHCQSVDKGKKKMNYRDLLHGRYFNVCLHQRGNNTFCRENSLSFLPTKDAARTRVCYRACTWQQPRPLGHDGLHSFLIASIDRARSNVILAMGRAAAYLGNTGGHPRRAPRAYMFLDDAGKLAPREHRRIVFSKNCR